jgi:uncharacterized membrane protein
MPSCVLQPILSFALLPAVLLALIKCWSRLSITSILSFLSVSFGQDLKSILAVRLEFWFIFFGDWKIAIIAVWLLHMIYRYISEDLSAASAEKWNDLEKEWVKYLSWFDPNCSKFRYLKEHIIFTGIKMRFKKQKLLTDQGFESLLKEALAQVKRLSKEVLASEDVVKEVAANEAVVAEAAAKEAAEEDEWEDI